MTKDVAELCWYMRGSITWDQAWRLSPMQRGEIMKVINQNIENTEKSGLPLV